MFGVDSRPTRILQGGIKPEEPNKPSADSSGRRNSPGRELLQPEQHQERRGERNRIRAGNRMQRRCRGEQPALPDLHLR